MQTPDIFAGTGGSVQPSQTVAVVPGPSSIRGKIVGARDASGTVTLELKDGPRVAKVEHGRFQMNDVPPGTWRLTYALEGAPNPAPKEVTIQPGEILKVELKVTHVGIQAGTPFADEVIAAENAEKAGDWPGARTHWQAALPLAPNDEDRVSVNAGIRRAEARCAEAGSGCGD